MKLPFSVSIIMPAFNEAENLPKAVQECVEMLPKLTTQYEVVVVDDCSTDETQQVLANLQEIYPCLIVIRNENNLGCHPSSMVGFKAACGDVLILLPADLQVSASNIPRFLAKINTYDLVCSYRKHRIDPLLRRLASRLYNLVLRLCFDTSLHDTHSAITVKREVVQAIVNDVKSNSAFAGCEFILRTLLKGFQVTEIEIDHLLRITGKAKGANLRDAIWTPINLLKFWWEVRQVPFRNYLLQQMFNSKSQNQCHLIKRGLSNLLSKPSGLRKGGSEEQRHRKSHLSSKKVEV